jgi:hypothetical protein
MFSPLRQDMPLFNHPLPRASLSRPPTRIDVPQPILRPEFCENLQEFCGPDNSVALIANGNHIDASSICCCNLADRPTTRGVALLCG